MRNRLYRIGAKLTEVTVVPRHTIERMDHFLTHLDEKSQFVPLNNPNMVILPSMAKESIFLFQ